MFRVIVGKRASVVIGNKGYRKQTVGVFLIDKDGVEDDFASPLEVMRGKDEPDYKAGEYTLHPCSFAMKPDDFGMSLQLGRIHLTPRVDTVRKTG